MTAADEKGAAQRRRPQPRDDAGFRRFHRSSIFGGRRAAHRAPQVLRAQLQSDQPGHIVGVGRAAAARGINVLRELVQFVALRVGNDRTFRGAAVGGERDAAGAARAASVVACVRAYVRRRRAVVRMSVLCQCCGQRRVLVCLRHV